MIDRNPGLGSAYEQYKAAKEAKEAALERINSRRKKLAHMPAPVNIAINLAQILLGLEYEYLPEDMRTVDRNHLRMVRHEQSVARELSRTPGEYPLSSLWYHQNAMINLKNGKPQPWAIHFASEIEDDYFYTVLKAEQIVALKGVEPQVHIRAEESPRLYLPDGYSIFVCAEPDWRCQNENVLCRANRLAITSMGLIT